MYYRYSENKGADQLHSYCTADLRLRSHMQKAGFLITRLICIGFPIATRLDFNNKYVLLQSLETKVFELSDTKTRALRYQAAKKMISDCIDTQGLELQKCSFAINMVSYHMPGTLRLLFLYLTVQTP